MFNTESYKEPFWAKSGEFIRGRDPLGIQNSSISVYSKLLPGMTNLTLRIRYYGFYVWLLDQYHQLPASNEFKQDVLGQYTFVRRAELIIAFLMGINHNEQQSIIGSNYVAKYADKFKSDGNYNIASGADIVKDSNEGESELYWGFKSGALGQYYVGSLVALGLIEMKGDGFFLRTAQKGVELSNAYNVSISENSKALLLKRIQEGNLLITDLESLEDFSISYKLNKTPEGEFYTNMLIEDDGKSQINASGSIPKQRQESLNYFLELTKTQEDWNNFPMYMYRYVNSSDSVIELENQATFGWYYYYLNELSHYCLETVFWGLLSEMEQSNYFVNEFIDVISEKIIQDCSDNYQISKDSSLLDVIETSKNEIVFDFIDRIMTSVKANETINGITDAILGFIVLYNNNESNLETIVNYALNHFLQDKNGNAPQLFAKYIDSSKELTFSEFVKKVVHTILNDHMAIAYNKMGNSDRNLLKFVLEDNRLVHIETMLPNFTTPRLKTLHNFLADLELLNEEGKITTAGNQLLDKLNVT